MDPRRVSDYRSVSEDSQIRVSVLTMFDVPESHVVDVQFNEVHGVRELFWQFRSISVLIETPHRRPSTV